MKKSHIASTLLVCLLVVGAFVYAHRKQKAFLVGNEFKQISLSLQNFISANTNLPPAVAWGDQDPPSPLYSWRLIIAPYLHGGGYPPADLQSPWDSEGNLCFHKMRTSLSFSLGPSDNPGYLARIYAVTGADTAFGAADEKATDWYPEKLPTDTIIAIEVGHSDKHWMEPVDYEINTIGEIIVLENGHLLAGASPDRFHVIFADFEVWALSTETPFVNLKNFLSITGASVHDRDELLAPYCLGICYDGG